MKINISTTWAADLDIYLVSPSGTIVELSTDNGGSGDNYIDTVFDDAAATSITTGTAPFTGTYRPEQPLNTLIGQPANGTWRLRVTDDLSSFPGTINAWSITMGSTEPNTFADATGAYSFGGLAAGTYNVRQVPIAGNTLTQPASGFYNLNLVGGQIFSAADFGNSTAAVPAVITSNFVFDGATLPAPPHALTMSFTQPVGQSLDAGDLQLVNTTTSTTVPTANVAVAYNSSTNTATFTFPGYTNGVLPDGNYTATLLAAGVTVDGGGLPMVADYVTNFFVLAGDANHDGNVNLDDFNVLAANFGQSPRIFSQADFTYDGVVNLDDFNLLASRFGTTLNGARGGGGQATAPQAPTAPSGPKTSSFAGAFGGTRIGGTVAPDGDDLADLLGGPRGGLVVV